jgi:hypothetical protein
MDTSVSWYTGFLLKNRLEIRTNGDIESDEFNDLIVIEKKIKSLYMADIISKEEMNLIDYVADGKPMANSKENYGKNRISLAKDFSSLCRKIAFYVGGQFTDDGYVDYMKNKHHLTEEQVQKLHDYMNSKYKNKLMRKQKKTK